MKTIILTISALLTLHMTTMAQKKELLYIGTYTEKGEGIYVYEFDRKTQEAKELQVVKNKNSPSFLEFHPNGKTLYASNEGNDTVESYRIDPVTGKLTELNTKPSKGNGPCHVSVDPKGRFLYVSNYGSGELAVYKLEADGSIGALTDHIQNKGRADQKPHMHSIVPAADGQFIYASDLGIDKISIYRIDDKTGKLSPAGVPYAEVKEGDGPRHFAIHPNKPFAYSACELTSHVNAFQVVPNTGALVPLQRISMLPEDYTGKSYAADIHFSPDGKFLYASNRGHDSIVIYAVDDKTGKLTVVDYPSAHGKHPRNFNMDRTGNLLFVASRDTDNVALFNRDPKTGKLTYSGHELSIPTPVCVKPFELK